MFTMILSMSSKAILLFLAVLLITSPFISALPLIHSDTFSPQQTSVYNWFCVSSEGVSRYCNQDSFEVPSRGCHFVYGVREVYCVNTVGYQRVLDSYCTQMNQKPIPYQESAVIQDCEWRVLPKNERFDTTYGTPLRFPVTITSNDDVFIEKCPPCQEIATWSRSGRERFESLNLYQTSELMCYDGFNQYKTDFQLCKNVQQLADAIPQQHLNCTATCEKIAAIDVPTAGALTPTIPKSPRWVVASEECTGCALASEVEHFATETLKSLIFKDQNEIKLSRTARAEMIAAYQGSVTDLKLIATGLGKRVFKCVDKHRNPLPDYECNGAVKPDAQLFSCIAPYAHCGQGRCTIQRTVSDKLNDFFNYGQCTCDNGVFSPLAPSTHTSYSHGFFVDTTLHPLTSACSLNSTITIQSFSSLPVNTASADVASQTVNFAPSTTASYNDANMIARGDSMIYTLEYTLTLPNYTNSEGITTSNYNSDHKYNYTGSIALIQVNSPTIAYPITSFTMTPTSLSSPSHTSIILPSILPHDLYDDLMTYTTPQLEALPDTSVVPLYNLRLSLNSDNQKLFGTAKLVYDIANSGCNTQNTDSVDPINGTCVCKAGWVGSRCDASYCSLCNSDNTVNCHQATAKCVCKSTFDGEFCTNTICPTTLDPCLDKDNNYIPNNNGYVLDRSCKICTCYGLFSGEKCKTCNGCLNAIVGTTYQNINTSECGCKCNPSYFGNMCQCQEYYMSLTLDLSEVVSDQATISDQEKKYLKQAISSELMDAMDLFSENFREVTFETIEITPKQKSTKTIMTRVTITIAPICYRTSPNPYYYTSPISPTSSFTSASEHQAQDSNILNSFQNDELHPSILANDETVQKSFILTYSIPPRLVNNDLTLTFGSESISEAHVFKPNARSIHHRPVLSKMDTFRNIALSGELANNVKYPIISTIVHTNGVDLVDTTCDARVKGCLTISGQVRRKADVYRGEGKKLPPTALGFIILIVILIFFAAIVGAIYYFWYKPRQAALEEAREKRRKKHEAAAAEDEEFHNNRLPASPSFAPNSPSYGPNSPVLKGNGGHNPTPSLAPGPTLVTMESFDLNASSRP